MNFLWKIIRKTLINTTILFYVFYPVIAFAIEKENTKTYTLDLITKMDCECGIDADNKLLCSIWFEKTRFIIGSVVNRKVNTEETIGNVLGQIGSSGGLMLPIVILFPDLVKNYDYSRNSVSIIEAKVVGKLPAKHETIKIFHNGNELGDFRTNQEGKLEFISAKEGVYEVISYSDTEGVCLNKEMFLTPMIN